MTKFDSHKMYLIEGCYLNGLANLKDRLYRWDSEKWPIGEHRDWANWLDGVLLRRVEELPDEGKGGANDG